eukprot:SAG11_NODE_1306_length_5245_cov_6.023513_3_plen_80_part_00
MPFHTMHTPASQPPPGSAMIGYTRGELKVRLAVTLIPGSGIPLHSHSAVWLISAARDPFSASATVEAPSSRQPLELKLW